MKCASHCNTYCKERLADETSATGVQCASHSCTLLHLPRMCNMLSHTCSRKTCTTCWSSASTCRRAWSSSVFLASSSLIVPINVKIVFVRSCNKVVIPTCQCCRGALVIWLVLQTCSYRLAVMSVVKCRFPSSLSEEWINLRKLAWLAVADALILLVAGPPILRFVAHLLKPWYTRAATCYLQLEADFAHLLQRVLQCCKSTIPWPALSNRINALYSIKCRLQHFFSPFEEILSKTLYSIKRDLRFRLGLLVGWSRRKWFRGMDGLLMKIPKGQLRSQSILQIKYEPTF